MAGVARVAKSLLGYREKPIPLGNNKTCYIKGNIIPKENI